MLPSFILKNTRKPVGFFGSVMIKRMNKHHTPLSEWAFSLIEIPKKGRLLDIGCGGGTNLKRMLDFSPGSVVYGLDYSELSVETSKKLCNDYGGRCIVLKANVKNIPYDENYFDLITAFETVFFWKDLEKSFSEVYRVCKPNGMFVVVCEMSDPSETKYQDKIPGLNILSAEDIEKQFIGAGFVDINIERKEKEWICVSGKKCE